MNAVPHEFNPFFIGDQIVVLIIATSIIIVTHGFGMLGRTMTVADCHTGPHGPH